MDAIYARQSVDKKDSLSIQGQIDLCRHDTSAEANIYQDKGYSGKNTNRPDFQRLMADVEQGKIQKIVVYRLDRFSRSLADFSRLWETLQKHGVEFVSINEKFDTASPMGRAMLSIIMVFAQLERETTAERVRDNYYQRAALGSWPGGPAPYGFTLGRTSGGKGQTVPTLIPNDRQETVVHIFTQYAAEGASLGSVARSLNDRSIPAPKRATWDNVTLSRILHSPLYVMADEEVYLYYAGKGVAISNPLEDFDALHGGMLVGKRNRSAGKYTNLDGQHFSLANHFGLVPAELWLRCQYKLEGNRQLGGNGRGKHTWLSGLLKCACCGYSVKVNRDGEKYYLVCSGRSNLGLCDQSIQVNLRELEAAVEGEMEQLLSQCPPLPPEHDPVAQETALAVSKIEQRIERLIAALAESTDISMPYINRELARLDAERQTLLAEQEKRHSTPSRAKRGQLVFPALDFEEKKLVAAQFIQKIQLADNRADVIWQV